HSVLLPRRTRRQPATRDVSAAGPSASSPSGTGNSSVASSVSSCVRGAVSDAPIPRVSCSSFTSLALLSGSLEGLESRLVLGDELLFEVELQLECALAVVHLRAAFQVDDRQLELTLSERLHLRA